MSNSGRLTAVDHVNLSMPRGGEEIADGFYRDLFGLTIRDKAPDADGRWSVGEGFEVHLGAVETFLPQERSHPAFRVDDLDSLAARLTAEGLPFHPEYLEGRVVRTFTADPFGNRIELIEHSYRP